MNSGPGSRIYWDHAFGEVSLISPSFLFLYAKCNQICLYDCIKENECNLYAVLIMVLRLILVLHTLPVPNVSKTVVMLT